MEFRLENPSRVDTVPSDTWATPWWVVDWVRYRLGWGKFDFDPCCEHSTAKAEKYITPEIGDGLVDPWYGQRVWVNPPYSNQGAWLKRCADEAKIGRDVVALVMPSFDTSYWRPNVWNEASEIWMVEGRIAFEADGEPRPGGNVRSCFIVYRANQERNGGSPIVHYLKPEVTTTRKRQTG